MTDVLPGRTSLDRVRFVARLSWRVWRREVARSLGISVRIVDGALVATAVIALAVAVLVGGLVISVLLPLGTLPSEVDRSPYLRLVFAGTAAGAALTQTLMSATASEQSSLRNLLSILPVGRIVRSAGVAAPGVTLAFGATILLTAPSSVVIVVVQWGALGALIGSLGLQLLLITLVSAGAPAMYSVLRRNLRERLHLPGGYANVVATLIVGAIAVAAFVPDLSPVPRDDGDLSALIGPVGAAVEIAAGRPDAVIGALVLLAWAAVAVALCLAAALAPASTRLTTWVRLLVGVRMPRRGRAATFWVQVLRLVRTPQFVVLATLPLLLAAALVVSSRDPVLAPLVSVLAGVPAVAPFAIGMYGVGAARGSQWVERLAGISRARTVADLAMAALAVGAAPAVLGAVVLTVGGVVHATEGAAALTVGFVLWAAAITGGSIAPYSADQALSATITGAVSFVLFALVTIPVQLALSQVGEGLELVGSAIGLVAALGAFVSASVVIRSADPVIG